LYGKFDCLQAIDTKGDSSGGDGSRTIRRVIRGWWSENIEGSADTLGDEFSYRYKNVHRCKMKLIEVVPHNKLVWLVVDNNFSGLEEIATLKRQPGKDIYLVGGARTAALINGSLTPSVIGDRPSHSIYCTK